ncbi:putative stromal cell-derived factor 2 [Paratrimastix pyriformis]|uniref:Stromal cell-derived factor 2 n=1 Tax=Paratrimastix pyriformis TaxID=342808 RepID=A0ABQ8UPZ2_9EUKA|nr:putative stromal cell-derived factor 2 [Paratrimastix pyriformis]
MRWRSVILVFAATALVASAHEHHKHDDDESEDDSLSFDFVTCGSVIKLVHKATGYRLHSHEVPYGGQGSGQQSVTCFPNSDDSNSLWTVKGAHGSQCKRGTPIQCDATIRLEHAGTHKNLHSHLFRSPLSQQQEVSAFGDASASGDTGDNWKVECVNPKKGQTNWVRGQTVRLVHADTGKLLHSHAKFRYGNPIPGQQEVTAFEKRNPENEWASREGVYVASELSEPEKLRRQEKRARQAERRKEREAAAAKAEAEKGRSSSSRARRPEGPMPLASRPAASCGSGAK